MNTNQITGAAVPAQTEPVSPRPAATGIARLAARGMVYMAGGQTALRVVGLIGTTLLARVLAPKDFGIYALTSFAVLQLGAIADLGLGSKLIHDSTEASVAQKRSVFALHTALALLLYLITYTFAATIAKICSLGADGASFCRLVGLIILMFPFRAIPTAMLNRQLRFGYIATSEAIGGVLFQLIAVIFAYRGWSYWSFGVALLVSTAARTIILNIAYPWPIGFALDMPFLRHCVRFGSAFQMSSLTAVFRDNIINFLGGPLFGPAAVGLLAWALRVATYASQTYVGICSNISFPSLSRVRSDPRLFGAMLSRMLRYVNLATLLTLSLTAGLAPQLTSIIFTDKWLPAVPLLYCFAIRMIGGNYTTLLDLALKAQGRPERSFRIMFWWTILEWVGAVVASELLGFKGIAVSYAVCVWFAVGWLAIEVKKHTTISIFESTANPMAAGAVTLLLLKIISGHVTTLPVLVLAGAAGAGVFLIVYRVLEGHETFMEIRRDLRVLFGRKPVQDELALGMNV